MMFRNCPYEGYAFDNCRQCPNYKYCVAEKQRRLKRRQRRARAKVQRLVMTLFVLITSVVTLCMTIGIAAKFISIPETENVGMVGSEKPYVQQLSFEITSNKDKSIEVENVRVEIYEGKTTEDEKIEVTEAEAMIVDEEEATIEDVLEKLGPSAYGTHDVYIYDLSWEDKVYIAKVVWAEARGESFEGKVAVAAVVLNRFFYGDPGLFDKDSIYSIITQRGAFASIYGVTEYDLENVPECMEAVEAACKGFDPTREAFPETGALYFYNPNGVKGYQAEIRKGIEVVSIGAHNFHIDFNVAS